MSTHPFPDDPGRAPAAVGRDAWVTENAAAISRYIDVRCVARGLNPQSRHNRRLILERFLRSLEKPIWEVLPADYDRFMAHHVLERDLAPSTHRYYQSALDRFFSYLADDLEYQAHLQRTYGARLANPIGEDNRIIHKAVVQHKTPHYALTREEIETLFDGIARLRDGYLRRKGVAYTRYALCVERDRVAFGVQYYLALRVGEVCNLNMDSFETAPWDKKRLGKFGMARVVGKGMPMQGPKARMSPATTIELRPLMEWYLAHIRPQFPNARSNKALFLSMRGTRACRSSFMHSFKKYLIHAGIDPERFSTHALRRSGVTHDSERAGIGFGMMKAGHEWESTTQIYINRPPSYVQEQANRLVSQTMKSVKKPRGT